MKERILEFLKSENLSSAQFADEIGVQPSSISHIISGRNNPSLDFIIKMLNKYQSLSTDWLLFGKGKMYREPQLNDLFGAIESSLGNDKTVNNIISNNADPITTDTGLDLNKSDVRMLNKGSDKAKRIVFFFDDGTFKEYFSV